MQPDLRRARPGPCDWCGSQGASPLAGLADTQDCYALVEAVMPDGEPPPPCANLGEPIAFYLLEGEIDCQFGRESVAARPGDLVHLPGGRAQRFAVRGDRARALWLLTPRAPGERPSRVRAAKQAIRAGGRRSRWYGGRLCTPLLRGCESRGRVAVVEAMIRRGHELPRHAHHREDEAWYVLEGEARFQVGERVYRGRPGDLVLLPRGIPHEILLVSDRLRAIAFLSPPGLEEHILECSQPAPAALLPPSSHGRAEWPRVRAMAAARGIQWVKAEASEPRAASPGPGE